METKQLDRTQEETTHHSWWVDIAIGWATVLLLIALFWH